jgi:hypothetical protein
MTDKSDGKLPARWSWASWRRQAIGQLWKAAIVVAFTTNTAGAVWLFLRGYWLFAAMAGLFPFLLAVLFDGGTAWRVRIAFCFTFLSAAIGGWAGLRIYWAMFSFAWFTSIFNDDAAGPLGMLFFLVAFSVAAGFAMTYLLTLLGVSLSQPTRIDHPAAGADKQRTH